MEADAKVRADHLARQVEEECKRWESAVDASLSKAEKELEERRRDLEQERKQKQDWSYRPPGINPLQEEDALGVSVPELEVEPQNPKTP